jgi:hypothetical protein
MVDIASQVFDKFGCTLVSERNTVYKHLGIARNELVSYKCM